MTVRELIEKLQECNQDANVFFDSETPSGLDGRSVVEYFAMFDMDGMLTLSPFDADCIILCEHTEP